MEGGDGPAPVLHTPTGQLLLDLCLGFCRSSYKCIIFMCPYMQLCNLLLNCADVCHGFPVSISVQVSDSSDLHFTQSKLKTCFRSSRNKLA